MRALFYDLERATEESEVVVSGDRAHHLNVVRVKVGEDLLLLNGQGQRFFSKIVSVTKKEIVLKISRVESGLPNHQINLAISLPKKDAFEDILKIAVELGISNIQPLSSEFSQYEYAPSDRVERLLESALVQSNNLYLPKIANQIKLEDYLKHVDGHLVYFSAKPSNMPITIKANGRVTVLVGPEGGFSSKEEEMIHAFKDIKTIHLPTPILRAPTAVATSVGYLLAAIS